MTFEYGGKADEGILIFGLICAVGALILKYFRIRERGTVLSPKKTDEEKKAHLASGLKKEEAPPDPVAREKDISEEIKELEQQIDRMKNLETSGYRFEATDAFYAELADLEKKLAELKGDDKDAMYLDYNLTIREIFSQVEGVSQHGLDELFDDEVRQGKKSFASEIVRAGIATKEDILSLVGQYLAWEVQIGEVEEIEPEVLALIQPDIARQYAIVPLYLSEGGIHLLAADPFNTKIIDDLTYSLKMEPFLIVCDSEKVDRLIEKYYGKTM